MQKPWYWPDTQGFLAVAIISVVSGIVFLLLLHPIQMTDTVQGVLMTLIGLLGGTLKEVYSFYFSSSSSSKTKDDTINTMATVSAEAPKIAVSADPLARWTAITK